jgi:ABC-2 type transport system ATP-binding protein
MKYHHRIYRTTWIPEIFLQITKIRRFNMKPAIEVQSLHKYFGDLKAVQDATFSVETGEVLSLLGPNGAGKSTTISMLSGLLEPTKGQASIMGHSILTEPEAAKACLGVVPQDIALYPDMSARENLVFWGKMYGLRGATLKQRVDEVLEVIARGHRPD